LKALAVSLMLGLALAPTTRAQAHLITFGFFSHG